MILLYWEVTLGNYINSLRTFEQPTGHECIKEHFHV